MNLFKSIAILFSGVLSLFAEGPAVSLRPDVEVDPTPYLEHGYSFHAGIGWGHWRVEGEALGTDVPEWVHGNRGFDVSDHGAGAKLQYFLSPQQRGIFAGMRTEIIRESVRLHGTDLEARPLRYSLGMDAGYRFRLGLHLYVTPWAGVDYTFNARDIEMGGRRYKDGRAGVFAAVHFGYRW